MSERNRTLLWIARDEDDTLAVFTEEPEKVKRGADDEETFWWGCERMELDEDLFPEVTFENSPQRVELKLIAE